MKKQTRTVLTSIFALFYAALFGFIIFQSLSSGKDSSAQSGMIVNFLVRFDAFKKLEEEGYLSDLVRKLIGHFSEFGLLGIFGFFTFYFAAKKPFGQIIGLSCGLVSCSISEIMQFFAESRAPEFTDVLIDFQGYLSAFLILIAVFYLLNLKHNDSEQYIKRYIYSVPFILFVVIPFLFINELTLAKMVCYIVFLIILTVSTLTIMITQIIVARKNRS